MKKAIYSLFDIILEDMNEYQLHEIYLKSVYINFILHKLKRFTMLSNIFNYVCKAGENGRMRYLCIYRLCTGSCNQCAITITAIVEAQWTQGLRTWNLL